MQQGEIDKLSDKIDKLSDALAVTHTEMVRTQTIIREYNGLREKIESQGRDILVLMTKRRDRERNWANLRGWGNWAAALGGWTAAGVALLMYLSQVFHW